ncbi:glutaminyl-peptide cyclotransferase [Desulfocurvus sp. DL9XJH121]
MQRVPGFVLFLLLALAVACPARAAAPVLPAAVLGGMPHDTEAFTQGLFFHQGRLYETTGRRGRSRLAELDPATGRVLRTFPLDKRLFGEGAAAVDGACWWLTWTAGRAFRIDLATFRILDERAYGGQGWGLAHDGAGRLYMSDGSDILTVRDSGDFRELTRLPVRDGGRPVSLLNELEWVDGLLYANVWGSPRVAVIDPATGRVLAWLDLSSLVPANLPDSQAVANGLAWDREGGCLLVTGKLWPQFFRLRLPDIR